MNNKTEYTISGEERPLKDVLLREIGLSVTRLKKIKFSGLYVNGERVTVRKAVKAGDILTIVSPDEEASVI